MKSSRRIRCCIASGLGVLAAACGEANRPAPDAAASARAAASTAATPRSAVPTATLPAWSDQKVAEFVGRATLTGPVSFVKLEELSEVDGKPFGSMAEFNLIDASGATVNRTGWIASADSAGSNDAPAAAIDGNAGSIWHTAWGDTEPPPPHRFVVQLPAPFNLMGFRYLPRQDGLRNGAFGRFRFFVSRDGVDWGQPIAQGDFADLGPATAEQFIIFGQRRANHRPTIEALSRQSSETGQAVSWRAEASDVDGDALRYTASGLPAGVGVKADSGEVSGAATSAGTFSPTLTVHDSHGATASATFEWTVAASANKPMPSCAATPGTVCHVKLEEVSEINGRAFGSMAEFDLLDEHSKLLPRSGWVASADSSTAVDAPDNAIDGDPRSIWHTQWDGDAPRPPHTFVVHLAAPANITGFRYLARQDGVTNGTIAKYRFFVSADGVNWGPAVAEGDLTLLGGATSGKTVYLK